MTAYRPCTDRDLPDLKRLWLSCFEEREDAAALFFQDVFPTCHAYACEADGRPVSALYLIDCFSGGERAHYLCGAATLPPYRGRGMMSSLITYALQDAARRGDRYSLLYPASERLYGFYERLGYLPSCAAESAVLSTETDRKPRGGCADLQTLQAACADDRSLIWRPDLIRFAASYYGCYGAETAQDADAFAIFQRDGDLAEVIYTVYRELDALKALLQAKKLRRFRMTAPAKSPLPGGELIKPSGMIRSLCGKKPPENVFIGITLQ